MVIPLHYSFPMNNYAKQFRNLGVALAGMAALAGMSMLTACGKDDKKVPATQVVARVNGAEISVHQINDALARAAGVTQQNADRAKREILDRLVDQQLAIEQAEAAKLDRNPNVMRAIEAAKREIIARAHLDQVAAGVGKATSEEARKYYAEHPELFSQRRVYSLQEVLTSRDARPVLERMVSQNRTMQEITGALNEAKIPFAANAGVRAAEQLPLALAAKLHGVKTGQTAIFDVPDGITIVHVVASQTQPVSEEKALPSIETFLTNQRKAEAVAAHMKSLRDKAKIERLGDFAQAADAPGPAAAGQPAPATAPQAAAPGAKPEDAGGLKAEHVAKGVSGLK